MDLHSSRGPGSAWGWCLGEHAQPAQPVQPAQTSTHVRPADGPAGSGI